MIVCLHILSKGIEGFMLIYVICNYMMIYSRKTDIYGEAILTMLAIINIANLNIA